MQKSMHHYFTALLLIISISTLYGCQNKTECPSGINLLPMYGNVEKCEEQLKSDSIFISQSDKRQPDRSIAAIEMLNLGWKYIHQGDYETAMKRINQAWLLDSTNIVIYDSFAVILELTEKRDDAIKMLDLTLKKFEERVKSESQSNTFIPDNDSLIKFIVLNVPFTYKKDNNPMIGKYIYKKLDSIDIPENNKIELKKILKEEISEIDLN